MAPKNRKRKRSRDVLADIDLKTHKEPMRLEKERRNSSGDKRDHWRGLRILLSLVKYTEAQLTALLEVLSCVIPWSFVILIPYFYALGTFASILVLGYFGFLAMAIYLIAIYMPLVFIVHKAIKHESETQVLAYVDRWEGNEKQQKEALEYLMRAKAKKNQ